MRRILLPVQMTLDGFATGPNGEMDWLPLEDPQLTAEHWEETWNELRSVDTLLLGRVTYQVWERFWPAVRNHRAGTPHETRFARWVEGVEKVVFSRTLSSVEWNRARLVRDHPVNEIARLKHGPGRNLALAGGARLAQSFIRWGLIDEYLITVHPVLLGEGRPLFGELGLRRGLRLVGSHPFRSGAVLLKYRPPAEP